MRCKLALQKHFQPWVEIKTGTLLVQQNRNSLTLIKLVIQIASENDNVILEIFELCTHIKVEVYYKNNTIQSLSL